MVGYFKGSLFAQYAITFINTRPKDRLLWLKMS